MDENVDDCGDLFRKGARIAFVNVKGSVGFSDGAPVFMIMAEDYALPSTMLTEMRAISSSSSVGMTATFTREPSLLMK